MNRLTNEQRLQIIEFYYKNACSVKKVYRALLLFYGQFNRPTEAAIRAIVTKFRTKFTLLDITPPTRLRRVRTEENIAAVLANVNDDHQLSIRRRSQQLGLCYSTTWTILRNDLGVKPFKIQLVQELKPNDLSQRRIFGEWAHGKFAEYPLFYRKIVYSDEAHFWINGYVNKQNCRFEDNFLVFLFAFISAFSGELRKRLGVWVFFELLGCSAIDVFRVVHIIDFALVADDDTVVVIAEVVVVVLVFVVSVASVARARVAVVAEDVAVVVVFVEEVSRAARTFSVIGGVWI